MNNVQIKACSLKEIAELYKTIEEFDYEQTLNDLEDRVKGKEYLSIAGYIDNKPAGFMVSYDRHDDDSLYCWLTATSKEFRRQGVLSSLMDYQYNWAREKGYKTIKIKTHNEFKNMQNYLINNGYFFTDIKVDKDPNRTALYLERTL